MVKTGRQKPKLQSDHPNSSDEEINLSFQIRKTIVMKVKKSETLENVKAMICDKEGISEDLQELSFAGNRIGDELRIMESAIPENSTIHLTPREPYWMKLYFKMPANEKTFELEVQGRYTIGDIKSVIQANEGIPGDKYSIYYAGKVLESYRTVASLNIENEATLQMISVPKDMVSIIVETPIRTVRGEVRTTHTVLDVKKILESIINLPSESYELFKGRKQLQNMKTLAYYDVKEYDTLKLLPGPYQISVETSFGITLAIEVVQSDTIADVKCKIAEEEGGALFKDQRLIFDSKVLEDDKNLASYGIKKESKLYLSLKLRSDPPPDFQLI